MQQSFFDTEPSAGKSFIYRSSAGSGKTFTLAKAYLKLVLLDPSRYNKILAITFTNKAKDEMKTRIIRDLTSLASGEPSDIRTAILAEFEAEGYERIADVVTSRAQLVLTSLLHDYSRFHVSTIDHFFTQLIRHLARELKLNLGYELDVDSATALSESIDLLFKNANKELLKWLNDFALEQIENEKGWDIRKNIADLGGKLFQESYLDIADSLRDNISRLPDFISEQQKTIRKFRHELTEAAKLGVSAAEKFGLQEEDFKNKVPLELMLKISNGQNEWSKLPAARFLNATTLDTWHTKASQKVELIASARTAGMEAAHNTIIGLYEGPLYRQYLEATAILRFIHSYGVLSSLSKSLQEYRSENNLMFVSDSAFVLHEVISASETPFIYEKIGSELSYILIDEFQDTSAYQWKTLLPFFKSVLSNSGQVYVVGDVKQSIYGWRGGDLNLLLHQVEYDLNVDKTGIIQLLKNYRSAENIIRFNNSFFKVAAAILPAIHKLDHFKPEFELAYHDVEQQVHKNYPGYVDVRFLKDDKDNKWVDQAHKMVKKQIKEALENGFTRNDIMLLTRTTEQATRLANYLLIEKIAAISESALRLTSSPRVQLLIASLKFLVNEENKVAIAEFNHFLAKVNHTPTKSYSALPDELRQARYLKTRPVYEALEELILQLGLNTNSDIYLLKFLDLALVQSKRARSTIPDFLEWWNEQESRDSKDFSLSIPESEDAVIVLTIHKAKGLEKPVIILPYADDQMRPKNSIFWARPLPEKLTNWGSLPLNFSSQLMDTDFLAAYQKHYFDNLLESLNLLYVAFTRAGERLHIISKADGAKTNSSNLIYEVLNNDSFQFQSKYDANGDFFSLGSMDSKQAVATEASINTEVMSLDSYPIAENLVVDTKHAELFLEIAGEKSAKVKEGIVIHEVLSLLQTQEQMDEVFARLEKRGLFDKKEKAVLKNKVKTIFANIPALRTWFTGDYEVINERKIYSKGSTYIPDRLMIKEHEAIIIDYKREVQDEKHKAQVRKYRDLLKGMGFTEIQMYLLYVDEARLLKVDD